MATLSGEQGGAAEPRPGLRTLVGGWWEKVRDSISGPRFIVAALVLLGLGLIPPLPNQLQEALLDLALSAACLIPVAEALHRRRFQFFELGIAVSVVYFVLFPIRAAVDLLSLDFAAHQGVLTAPFHVIRLSLLSATLGMTAGGAAYIWSGAARLGARVRLPRVGPCEEPSLALAIPTYLVGLAAEGLILTKHAATGRESGLVSASSVLMIIGLCLLTRRALVRRDLRSRLVLAVAILAGIAAALGGQYKETAILTLAAVLVMWYFTRPEGFRVRVLVITALFVMFVLFPIVNVGRLESTRLGTNDPIALARGWPHQAWNYNWVASAHLDRQRIFVQPLMPVLHRLYGFDAYTLAVRYTPSKVPYQPMRTLKGLAAGLVPRVIWPNKPHVGLSQYFSETYWDPGQTGVARQAVTHPGELWIAFGLPGVIIGLALLGLWYRFVWTATRPAESATGATLYIVVLLTLVVVDRDIEFAYVTLVQRIVATALFFAAVAASVRLLRLLRPYPAAG